MFLTLMVPGLAMAKTNVAFKPGSFAYFLDRGIEKFTLFFVINQDEREQKLANIQAEMAEEMGINPEPVSSPVAPLAPEYISPNDESRIETMPAVQENTFGKPLIDIDLENMSGTITMPDGRVVVVTKPSIIKPVTAPVVMPTESRPITTKPVTVTGKPEVSRPITTPTEVEKPSSDMTPRINYWWGKVNQHMNIKTGLWETDPDGISGANLNMLDYCQKWYPETRSVNEYKFETIKHWKNRGNLLDFESTRMSYECSEKENTVTPVKPIATDPTPVVIQTKDDDGDKDESKIDSGMQIMYWWGKVNQHMEKGDWETDPDGVSGADLDMLTYCKKWYPNSIAVKENKLVTTDGWKNRGNLSEFTSTKMSYYCVQK